MRIVENACSLSAVCLVGQRCQAHDPKGNAMNPQKLLGILVACLFLSFQAACGSSGSSGTGGTTGGAGSTCNVDGDCTCGQVCSWKQDPHACVNADGGDPGWCNTSPNCLYQGQSCSGTSCTPAWTSASVCTKT